MSVYSLEECKVNTGVGSEEETDPEVRALWRRVFPELVAVLGHPERPDTRQGKDRMPKIPITMLGTPHEKP